jgi:UDP-glucose 4-epimerase
VGSILITGASGFIGRNLAGALQKKHDVIALSRRNPDLPEATCIRGSFASFEDLRQLDRRDIEAVIHLGAVTGGCTEHDAVAVNCEGTRCLMRYLVDRGCLKYVMASSIALVGMQSTAFRPLKLPIPDDHPCLDRDGYGLSKHLMEQITHYYSRQNEGIDVINLRLSSVSPDDARPTGMRELGPWALGGITVTLLSDVIELFTLAAEAPHRPGVRTMNATCARAWATVPTAEIVRHWYGNAVDVSHYEEPGHEYDSAYDVRLLSRELGFKAVKTLEALA